MTPFMSLLVPILVSAVAVFVLSSIIHMAMPWHRTDYVAVPDEDGLMRAMRPFNLPPGDYMIPRPKSGADMKSAEFLAKHAAGPVAIMTVRPNGAWNMGALMGSWFAFTVVVSGLVALLACTVYGPGAHDHAVFHLTALTSFIAYSMGAVPISIWYGRKWSTTLKNAFDSLIYGLTIGYIFSMMWPKT